MIGARRNLYTVINMQQYSSACVCEDELQCCDETSLLTPSLSPSAPTALHESVSGESSAAGFYNIAGAQPLSPGCVPERTGYIADFLSVPTAYNDISPTTSADERPVRLSTVSLLSDQTEADRQRHSRGGDSMISSAKKRSEDMNSVDILTELANYSAASCDSTAGSLSTPSSPHNLSQTFNTGNRNTATANRQSVGYNKVVICSHSSFMTQYVIIYLVTG